MMIFSSSKKVQPIVQITELEENGKIFITFKREYFSFIKINDKMNHPILNFD